MSVLLLGSTSMIGHQMYSHFKNSNIDVIGTTRQTSYGQEENIHFDVLSDDINDLLDHLPQTKTIVNNIGVIKSNIVTNNSDSEINAIKINSIFPHQLVMAAGERGMRVIQIATDCVYSGQTGHYNETNPHDAWDVYGKTKSLGEAISENLTILRCSVIGREQNRASNLIEWVLSNPLEATLSGYTNHLWNGITTLAFSKICAALISQDSGVAGVQHVIPRGEVTKLELVSAIASTFGRSDLSFEPVETPVPVDRTLSTITPVANEALWLNAGYSEVPTIFGLLEEYARYNG